MKCVLLADRHHELREGVRGLLGTLFAGVFGVTDRSSLLEGATRLQPSVIVMDLSLAGGDIFGLMALLREQTPSSKVLLLTVHDEPGVISAALSAGVDGVVLTRAIATDLLVAIETILAGKTYRPSPIR